MTSRWSHLFHDRTTMAAAGKLNLEKVNSLGYEEFVDHFGNVIEHCSVIAAGVWSQKPFSDVEHLHEVFSQMTDQLHFNLKEGILRCHPDLAGRLAQMGALTAESTSEQKSAGLHDMSEEERKNMNAWNQEYKAKFKFPFVICARMNKKDAILAGLQRRMQNSIEDEVLTGIEEVKKICSLRLADIVEGGPAKL